MKSPRICLALLLLLTAIALPTLGQGFVDNKPNPNQPSEVGVFMANGIFDPADTSYTPPSHDDFQETIMGRGPIQMLERRDQAVEFFLERYGIDFYAADFAQGGAVVLMTAYQDPRWNYRAYKLPGVQVVPQSGLIVHDAQYVMFTTSDAIFYGTWGGVAGTAVPAGTAAVDGEYLIQGTDVFKQGHPRNLHLTFQSTSPIFGAATGDIKFDCRVQGEELGSGVALGRQELYPLADGRLQVAIQNVLQFPAPQWAVEQDAGLLDD